ACTERNSRQRANRPFACPSTRGRNCAGHRRQPIPTALRTRWSGSVATLKFFMIKLRHIERFYPLAKGTFFYVLRDINLEVQEGDFVSIMGPSGAGKSTLLHILGMHDHGWTGEYFFNDTAV